VYRAYESIGIEILSAVLKKNNIQTELVYIPSLFKDALVDNSFLYNLFYSEKKVIKRIISQKPDIIAFSSLTDTYRLDISIARKIKHILPNVKIVFGGIHPTVLPEKVLRTGIADYVCVGEGEHAFCELVDNIRQKNFYPETKNICFLKDDIFIQNPIRPLISDIDTLPFPDKDLFYSRAPYFSEYYTIMTSRGCPYNCYFCNNNVYRKIYNTKRLLRRRSVQNVIEELETAYSKYKFKAVIFEDDAFVSQKDWTIDFLTLYAKKIKKPFQCLINPRNIDDKIAFLLKKAGCMNVEIGIQSMEESIRKEVLNRTENLQEIYSCINSLNKYRVPFNIDHIGGIPGESKINIKKSFSNYLKWNPNRITYFYLTYYPGTKVSQSALNKGLITREDMEKINDGKGYSFEHGGNVNPEDLSFHDKIRTIGDWGVFFPELFRKILTNKKIFNTIPPGHFTGRIIPAILKTLSGNEIRGVYILKKYIYHFLRGGF
jgi:radical SAM superfamily enzyme YgiQ (UPF0313 family)